VVLSFSLTAVAQTDNFAKLPAQPVCGTVGPAYWYSTPKTEQQKLLYGPAAVGLMWSGGSSYASYTMYLSNSNNFQQAWSVPLNLYGCTPRSMQLYDENGASQGGWSFTYQSANNDGTPIINTVNEFSLIQKANGDLDRMVNDQLGLEWRFIYGTNDQGNNIQTDVLWNSREVLPLLSTLYIPFTSVTDKKQFFPAAFDSEAINVFGFPTSGSGAFDYVFNPDGSINTIFADWTTTTLDAGCSNGGSAVMLFDYDQFGRMTSMNVSNPGWGEAGALQEVCGFFLQFGPTANYSFLYDSQNRLTAAVYTGPVQPALVGEYTPTITTTTYLQLLYQGVGSASNVVCAYGSYMIGEGFDFTGVFPGFVGFDGIDPSICKPSAEEEQARFDAAADIRAELQKVYDDQGPGIIRDFFRNSIRELIRLKKLFFITLISEAGSPLWLVIATNNIYYPYT